MPDTEKTLAAHQAELADNQAGALRAQHIRNFLVSALGGYAMIYVVDGAAPQAVTGTPAKLTGFTANGPNLGATPDHANDQITLGVDGKYWIEFSADVEASVLGTYTAELRKNGALEGSLKAVCEFEASSETRHWHFAGIVSGLAADVLTIFVSGTAANLTLKHARLAVKRIG